MEYFFLKNDTNELIYKTHSLEEQTYHYHRGWGREERRDRLGVWD